MLSARPATESEIESNGLNYRISLPESGSEGRPLVVLVHGRAGDFNVMWVFSKALLAQRPVVIAPQAFLPDPIGGFSWWPVREKLSESADAALRAERLAEVETGVLRVADFIDKVHRFYKTDPSRTFMAGFSQGGALSATLSLMRPGLLQGVAILAGFIPYAVIAEPGLVHPDVRNGRAKLPPYFVAHGTEDPIIPHSRALESVRFLNSVGAQVTFHEEAVKHKVGAAGIRALESWFSEILPSEP